ncbi:MAG: hypothetical protein U0270_20020 [Labilithrix sp.]
MMTAALSSPPASAPKEELADWLELRALMDSDRSSSLQDLVREIRRNGSIDALENSPDWGSSDSERVAQDAFGEVESRMHACGKSKYPFAVSNHSIVLRENYERSPYIFQLLLTKFGLVSASGLPSPEKTFEEIAAVAAQRYFGPDGEVAGFAFGFPRRYDAKNFAQALDHLCGKLGEGGGAKIPTADAAGIAKAKKIAEQKDGKVDIVAWRPFPDRRVGKLIGFGQCACGATDWRNKLSELQPGNFEKLWLREGFSFIPLRMFFVPRRVEEHDWKDIAIQAGILFDRCRITHHCGSLKDDLASECAAWTKTIIASRLLAKGSATKKARPKAGAAKRTPSSKSASAPKKRGSRG